MKTNQTLCLIAGCLLSLGASAQFFSDDFSVSGNWIPAGTSTTTGGASSGTLQVISNQLEFRGFRGTQTYRLQQDVGQTLNSGDKWRLEYEFTPNLVHPDNSAIISLVDDTSHFQANNTGDKQPANNNTSSIQVIYVDSIGPLNNRVTLNIGSKYLNTWQISNAGQIDVYQNHKYYVRAERLSASKVILSVYSDPARKIHIIGSPICHDIDPRISGLRYVQASGATSAGISRLADVDIDNMNIYDNTIENCEVSCDINAEFTFSESCDGNFSFINNSTLSGYHLKTIMNNGHTSGELDLGEDFSVQYPFNGNYDVCITVFGYSVNSDGTLECCSQDYCEEIEVTTAGELCDVFGERLGRKVVKSNNSPDLKLENSFTIAPNPTKDELTITFTKENSNIKIVSLEGRLIQSFSNKNELTKTINMSDLPSGIYFISVENGSQIETKKVVKQ